MRSKHGVRFKEGVHFVFVSPEVGDLEAERMKDNFVQNPSIVNIPDFKPFRVRNIDGELTLYLPQNKFVVWLPSVQGFHDATMWKFLWKMDLAMTVYSNLLNRRLVRSLFNKKMYDAMEALEKVIILGLFAETHSKKYLQHDKKKINEDYVRHHTRLEMRMLVQRIPENVLKKFVLEYSSWLPKLEQIESSEEEIIFDVDEMEKERNLIIEKIRTTNIVDACHGAPLKNVIAWLQGVCSDETVSSENSMFCTEVLHKIQKYEEIVNGKMQQYKKEDEPCQQCHEFSHKIKELVQRQDATASALKEKHDENIRYYQQLQELSQAYQEVLGNNKNLEHELQKTSVENARLMKLEELTATYERICQDNVDLQNQLTKTNSEIKRLREHLLEVENHYTDELLTAEKKLNTLKSLLAKEEDAYKRLKVYSERKVDELMNQLNVAKSENVSLETRLKHAEKECKLADQNLGNLQLALNLLEQNKKNDVKACTEQLRSKLKDAEGTIDVLKSKIKSNEELITKHLQENTVLKRCAEELQIRIGEKEDEINALKLSEKSAVDKMMELEGSLKNNSKMNLEETKSLLSNYLVQYLCSPAHTKHQILNIIASLLDFSTEQKRKVGLQPIQEPNEMSLSGSFVKYLVEESEIASPKISTLNDEAVKNDRKRQVQAYSQAPTANKSSNMQTGSLLTPDAALPSVIQFPVGQDAGSILRDVLHKITRE